MFVTKLSEIVSASGYTSYNGITLDSSLTFEIMMGQDLYITYRGLLDNKKVVIKLYIEDYSDSNNEIEILDYLQTHSMGFPVPYFSILNPKFDHDVLDHNADKMIIYEYIEGEPLTPSSSIDMLKLKKDVGAQLLILHNLGLVFADIRLENVIKLPNGNYFLIDYGRVFSIKDEKYPPMDFWDEDEVPTQRNDVDTLYRITKQII